MGLQTGRERALTNPHHCHDAEQDEPQLDRELHQLVVLVAGGNLLGVGRRRDRFRETVLGGVIKQRKGDEPGRPASRVGGALMVARHIDRAGLERDDRGVDHKQLVGDHCTPPPKNRPETKKRREQPEKVGTNW